jgi:hypothetical protein
MATRWDSFNSRLLGVLHKKWYGTFYTKFFQALKIYEEQKDLEQVVQELFSTSDKELSYPQALKNFGKGNVGRDQDVLRFLENVIFESILGILQGNSRQISSRIQILLSSLKIEEMPLHATLIRYKMLLTYLMKIPTLSSGVEEEALKIEVKTREDVAFFGCLSLLDALFLKKKVYAKTPYRGIFLGEDTETEGNLLGIDTGILDEIGEEVVKSTQTPSLSIQEWKELNKTVKGEVSALNLGEILPQILSASAFLWEKAVLGLSYNNVASLTEEKRLQLLLEKKTEVIERCFDHLKKTLVEPSMRGGDPFERAKRLHLEQAKRTDEKNQLIAKGRRVEELLKRKRKKQEVYDKWKKRERDLKSDFLMLCEEEGIRGREAALALLKIVSKKTLPMIEESANNGVELRLLKAYQKGLIEKAKIKEEIVDLSLDLEKARGELETLFFHLMDRVEKTYLRSYTNEIEVLKVYTTFSFILLNKDLFPPVSLRKEAQKKGGEKLTKLLEKWTKKRVLQALKKPESALEDVSFQERINQQVEMLYRAYQPQSESYKVRALSQDELTSLASVSKSIQESANRGDPKAGEKFFKLEKVLEKLLIEDHAFLASLDRAEKVDPQRASALQAHMDAALLFAKKQNSKPLTGESNSEGFQKLLETVLKSLSSEGIKEKIEKSNQELIRQAQELALPVREDTAVQILSKDIAGHSFNELKKQRLELVPLKPASKIGREKDLQKAYTLLRDHFEYQLYSEEYRWLRSYTGLEAFFQNLPEKTKGISFGREGLLYVAPFRALPLGIKTWIQGIKTPDKQRDFYLELRRFFQDNQFKMETLREKPVGIIKDALANDHIMLHIPVIANALKDEMESLEDKRQKYQVVLNSNPLNADRQIDIFSNQTLFQFFDRKKKESRQDRERAEGIYYDFLPIFISSFLTTERLLQKEGEKLRAAKMQFIEQMPFAGIIFEEFEEWMHQNQAGIKKINAYLEEETRKKVALLENDPQELTTFMEETLKKGKELFHQYFTEPTGGYLEGMKSWALSSSVITGGMLLAFAKYGVFTAAGLIGFMPLMIGTVLLSCVGGALLQESILPFLKSLLHTLWENFQNLLQVGDYGEAGPSHFLLKTFEAAFFNEMRSFDKFEETQHQLSYTFYMQELFEVMSHMQKNLLSFREKIHSLIPNTTKEANFSVMALSMFCMLNKDLFLLVPQEILQDVQNPHFLKSIEEYLLAYQQALEKATEEFQGERVLEYGNETPYSRFLKEQAAEGKIVLRFASNSNVGRFFERKVVKFAITKEQVVPFQKINPKQIASNVEDLLKTSGNLLKKRDRFEHELRKVLQKTEVAFKQPLNAKNTHQTYGLVSCFEIVRYAFSLSKMLTDSEHLDVSKELSEYLCATEASGSSIFSSHLFHGALSALRKTADFAAALDIPEGKALLRLIKELRAIQEEFLRSGRLHYPSFSVWQEIKTALFTLLDSRLKEHPMIAYPILVEFDSNKGMFLPLIIWNGFKQALFRAYGEEAIELIPFLNDSKILYLTNTEDTLLFTTPETRGFAVSPFVVEAMHQVVREYSNQELGQFLGRLSSRMQELHAAERAPLRYQLPFMRPLPQRQAHRAIENAPYEIPLQQSYMQPQNSSNQVLPELGLSRVAYDPENLGLSPEDAYVYYGDKLPQGVRNTLRDYALRHMKEGTPIDKAQGGGPTGESGTTTSLFECPAPSNESRPNGGEPE